MQPDKPAPIVSTRWQAVDTPRGGGYDQCWQHMAEAGHNVHGEADLIAALLQGPGKSRILDAGCGTGRVAIELARRGFAVEGVDADEAMLGAARLKAPELTWHHADLAELAGCAPGPFDLVALAGNVMIFVAPGTEGRVLTGLTARLSPGGLLVAGFSVRPGGLTVQDYDRHAAAAGLMPVSRWATWDREPFCEGEYVVTVHRRPRI